MPPEQYALRTDHIAEFVPPAGTTALKRDMTKFDALSRTAGWSPHTANKAGAQRAVYDPVSHKTSLYTFDSSGGVERKEGAGDALLLEKQRKDVQSGTWHGRRKGVVEFVDRTHSFAVNSNHDFLDTCARNDHAYHTQTGELTKWMDSAFASKCKVPFYGKTPDQMSK